MYFLPCSVPTNEGGIPWPDTNADEAPAVAFALEDVDPFTCSLLDLRQQLATAMAAGELAREVAGFLAGVLATRMVAARDASLRAQQLSRLDAQGTGDHRQ